MPSNDDEQSGFDADVLFYVWLVFVFWIAYIFGVRLWFGSWTGPGEFGDLFGGLNALFSGVAVALLIGTLLLQRKELRLQREELAKTSIQVERQAKSLEYQGKLLERQVDLDGELLLGGSFPLLEAPRVSGSPAIPWLPFDSTKHNFSDAFLTIEFRFVNRAHTPLYIDRACVRYGRVLMLTERLHADRPTPLRYGEPRMFSLHLQATAILDSAISIGVSDFLGNEWDLSPENTTAFQEAVLAVQRNCV